MCSPVCLFSFSYCAGLSCYLRSSQVLLCSLFLIFVYCFDFSLLLCCFLFPFIIFFFWNLPSPCHVICFTKHLCFSSNNFFFISSVLCCLFFCFCCSSLQFYIFFFFRLSFLLPLLPYLISFTEHESIRYVLVV